MAEPNKILVKMLDRLLAGLVNGPSMNCRPYASRQRLDLLQLGKLADVTPENVLRALLGPSREVTVKARAPMPKGNGEGRGKAQKLKVADFVGAADEHGIPLADGPIDASAEEAISPERAWLEQQAVLNKLHTIAEDARTYEQDTGVGVLNVGFPLLSLPPGTFGGKAAGGTKRVLAPLAFIPVAITVKRGAGPAIELACKGEGVDRISPNTALFAWLEQQTGKTLAESDADEEGRHPWTELCDIVRRVCEVTDIKLPEIFNPPPTAPNQTPASALASPRNDAGGPAPIRLPFATTAASGENGAATAPIRPPAGTTAARGENGATTAPIDPLAPSPGTPGEGWGEGSSHPVKDATADARNADEIPASKDLKIPHVDSTEPGNVHPVAPSPQRMSQRETLADHPSRASEESPDPMAFTADLQLELAPRADALKDAPQLLCSAVLGLFPMANQGLLRDMQAMLADENLTGPVESFIRRDISLEVPAAIDAPVPASAASPTSAKIRSVVMAEERFISGSDPCQARAVRMARECRGLVVHGPPGTGKSQTITNIIGDHLARGQRVLVVCDKRTALDVVYNRLSHMGLGNLCALVHDPRRDQRELYKSIRQQLDELQDITSDAKADAKLARADHELQDLHDELAGYHESLARRQGDAGLNFSDLVGHWLSLADCEQSQISIEGANLQTLETYSNAVAEVLARGDVIAYGVNPWVAAAGISLGDFLAQPMAKVRAMARACDQAAGTADATLNAAIPPFAPLIPLKEQVEARHWLVQTLPEILASTDPLILSRWAREPADALSSARRKIESAAAFRQTFDAGPLDAELLANVGDRPLITIPIAEQLTKLAAYQEIATAWYAFLPLRPKREAARVVNGYGLTLSAENAERIKTFITASRARVELTKLVRGFGDAAAASSRAATPTRPAMRDDRVGSAALSTGAPANPLSKQREMEPQTPSASAPPGPAAVTSDPIPSRTTSGNAAGSPSPTAVLGNNLAGVLPDELLANSLNTHSAVLDFVARIRTDRGFTGLIDTIAEVLLRPALAPAFVEGLALSPARAASLENLESAVVVSRFFAPEWLAGMTADFRAGHPTQGVIAPLAAKIDTLEGVVRVRQGLNMLPVKLRSAVEALLAGSVAPELAMRVLRREALALEISARLKSDPHLQEIDGHRIDAAFSRYRELEQTRRKLTRAVIQHRWISRQQDRLLAQTKSRLNTAGADLRRRLMLRGERALRLRQVVQVGRKSDGGDPLFDFCPIWLCSPETVAQVFPREAMFEVLVFDEASQMRLEESLPVLVRGKRVVIAGDPKQLPPTRFFESAFAGSEEDDAQTDQDLFEQHQGEIEDLLTAALGLDIQQCYLDVHYRSRNADLIAFSNEQFYGSRLQPIPGRPANAADEASVVLDHVGGTYQRQSNEVEADRIVTIVKDLLARDEPPSIGIACFNLVQRDLVAEKLDDLAAEEPAFARRLEKARQRQGEGSFEGLFIKNLENVQGDERDYILISTTYGPDASGKFHRRFGPLGRAGGGRRLNVLVTRARQKVHVVTSVPRENFRSLPELEPGQTPGGAWLLLAYLQFADRIGGTSHAPAAANGEVKAKALLQPGNENAESQNVDANSEPTVHLNEAVIETPASARVEEIAKSQAAGAVGSVHTLPTKTPSVFAEALARQLSKEQGISSDVHWGNDGFCVDLALHDPAAAGNISIGVLCDAARFAAADDPMQWDIFRTGMLEDQGWKLHRVWSPHFFRDPVAVTAALVAESQSAVPSAKADVR